MGLGNIKRDCQRYLPLSDRVLLLAQLREFNLLLGELNVEVVRWEHQRELQI